MRTMLFVVGALLLWTVPALGASSVQDKQQLARETDQPRGDQWEDRWQGRQHILYDELSQDGTDGHAVTGKADCRNFTMRYKRPDGTTAIRRENRCN